MSAIQDNRYITVQRILSMLEPEESDPDFEYVPDLMTTFLAAEMFMNACRMIDQDFHIPKGVASVVEDLRGATILVYWFYGEKTLRFAVDSEQRASVFWSHGEHYQLIHAIDEENLQYYLGWLVGAFDE